MTEILVGNKSSQSQSKTQTQKKKQTQIQTLMEDIFLGRVDESIYSISNEDIFKLTESFSVDMFVFELVIRSIGVDHDPLHAVTAELLLSSERQEIHS